MRQYCILCATAVGSPLEVCDGCLADLPTVVTSCPRCNAVQSTELTCGRCLRKPPPYQRCVAPFYYVYPADRLLKALKFGQRLGLAPLLGRLMAAELKRRRSDLPNCIIPVPLHRRRLIERGYNQALELARAVSQQLRVPLESAACERIRHTIPQASLAARDRYRNLQGAFKVTGLLNYAHVAILDDVVTTGHTVVELSQELLKAGVERVDVWSFAQTMDRYPIDK